MEQGDFLRELGIAQRADMLKRDATPEQAEQVDAALTRLAGGGAEDMGALFKVLAVTRRSVKEAPGFATVRRTHDATSIVRAAIRAPVLDGRRTPFSRARAGSRRAFTPR